MAYKVSDTFTRKLARLDEEGLIALCKDLNGKSERARLKFANTRSVKDGDRSKRLAAERNAAKNRLYLMQNQLGEFSGDQGDD